MTLILEENPFLVVVTGPTSSGKSSLAIWLAEQLDGELICCDSMQVYRGMDIGTAKPTENERNRVSHHLFDLVNPDETYSVGRFVRESEEVIKKLKLRKKIPILVGGTGMYLRSLLFGLSEIPEVSSNIKLQVKKWQKEEGTPACWQKLKEVDPEGEEVTFNKILGISFAFVAIFLSSIGDRKYSFNKNHLIIIVLLFIGQGLADGILNWAQEFILNGSNMNLFFAVTFLAAGFSGLLFLFFKISSQKVKIEPKSIIWGIVLGIPNYLTLLYFVKSLKSELFSSSEIFPIINIGVIIFCTIFSIILFRERVSIYNWLGVILGVFSIFIIIS